jgi:hypothetical protein
MDCGLPPLEVFTCKKESMVEFRWMRGDERLQDARRGRQGLLPQMLRARGNFTPGQQSTAVRFQRFLKILLRWRGIVIGREEADTHGQRAIALERETRSPQQKFARHLRHDADAIAALAIGGNCSPVREAPQRGQGMSQHLMRRLIRDTRNKANAARIMMKTGIE